MLENNHSWYKKVLFFVKESNWNNSEQPQLIQNKLFIVFVIVNETSWIDGEKAIQNVLLLFLLLFFFK